ncbi:MAG: flagellar filament capping protein FliD [Treponema sp.]|jgi:flagellar hook-associated protein 2|nr:flagellar filament capping protein FliD [Treponema sp.]
MSDIYVPGVKSRFNTETLIEGLMKVERIPKERAEKTIESLKAEKGYWQEIGLRISTLRESARSLYSFQNPFNERIAISSDESVLTGNAGRTAVEQERSFIVKQTAKADRFLSEPLDKSFRVEPGNYGFKVGNDEINLNFRGGSLREFTEALNRRGKDRIQAGIINVKSGTQSLLIESLVTGEDSRLQFSGASEDLVQKTGIADKANGSTQNILTETRTVAAGERSSLPFNSDASGMVLRFETATKVRGDTPPLPPRRDDMAMLSLSFGDGTGASLPLLGDSENFQVHELNLEDLARGKTIVSLEITNNNTHRDLSIRNVSVFDPQAAGGFKPRNPVSFAQDAVISMEGIEIRRSTNSIDDLLPGVTIIAKAPSDKPVQLTIEPNREAVKEAIISLVGNYNRLMAELNVVTRNDERVIQELSYLNTEEQEEMRKRLGAFSGDSTLSQFRNGMQRSVTSPYATQAEQDLLLPQIGIGTDVRQAGSSAGYDVSRMRGYLEIDEKALDTALADKLPAIQQLFGYDTDGDLLVDSGVAFALDGITKPYSETGGVLSLKTGTLDSKIDQEQRRISTLDRQLAAKEAALKRQYGNMENAFSRMEKMGTSLDQFSQRANANNR